MISKTIYFLSSQIAKMHDFITREQIVDLRPAIEFNRKSVKIRETLEGGKHKVSSMLCRSILDTALIGLLHLKSIHPLWKILKKCAKWGVGIFNCTHHLRDFYIRLITEGVNIVFRSAK